MSSNTWNIFYSRDQLASKGSSSLDSVSFTAVIYFDLLVIRTSAMSDDDVNLTVHNNTTGNILR